VDAKFCLFPLELKQRLLAKEQECERLSVAKNEAEVQNSRLKVS